MTTKTSKRQVVNKVQLISEVAENLNATKSDVTRIFNGLIDKIVECLKTGKPVSISGVMSMSVARRKEREGRHPQTGKLIKIPSKNYVKISAGSELKKAVEEETVA